MSTQNNTTKYNYEKDKKRFKRYRRNQYKNLSEEEKKQERERWNYYKNISTGEKENLWQREIGHL